MTTEKTEKTEKTETKTTPVHTKHAETVILPSKEELAAQGFYCSKGMFQDFRNMSLAPTG